MDKSIKNSEKIEYPHSFSQYNVDIVDKNVDNNVNNVDIVDKIVNIVDN